MFKKRLSKEEALQKLRHYCGYQERCHKEVKEKLYSFGLNKQDVEDAISKLIEENYLNEERFAIAYAGGYFRSKQWGKVKIGYELKQKGVSDYCIKKAMKEIAEDDYLKTIRELIAKKSGAIEDDGLNQYARKQKIMNYLLQRGFESQLIQKELKAEPEG
jgi:regulatory protein